MLRWMIGLAGLCLTSAVLGLGHVVPLASATQSMFLALTALSGSLLFCSFDAFETQASTVEHDEEG